MRMSVSEVIVITKKFLREEAGFDEIKISSVVAIEAESKWRVIAGVEQLAANKKEIIVDDRDGKIISYKQA